MFSVIVVKPPLQNAQDILLFEEKTALKISEPAVYGKGLAAALERCKVGISKLEVAYYGGCQQARQDMFMSMILTGSDLDLLISTRRLTDPTSLQSICYTLQDGGYALYFESASLLA